LTPLFENYTTPRPDQNPKRIAGYSVEISKTQIGSMAFFSLVGLWFWLDCWNRNLESNFKIETKSISSETIKIVLLKQLWNWSMIFKKFGS